MNSNRVQDVLDRDQRRCWYCGSDLEDPIGRDPLDQGLAQPLPASVDHQVPRVRGGGDNDENLVACCRTCNSRKGHRTVEEYRHYLKSLPNAVGRSYFFETRLANDLLGFPQLPDAVFEVVGVLNHMSEEYLFWGERCAAARTAFNETIARYRSDHGEKGTPGGTRVAPRSES